MKLIIHNLVKVEGKCLFVDTLKLYIVQIFKRIFPSIMLSFVVIIEGIYLIYITI